MGSYPIYTVSRMENSTHPAPQRPKRQHAAVRKSRPRRREKYAREACSLCKIRKVKCSGNQPCYRCDELQAECVYSEPSQSYTDNTGQHVTQLNLELSLSRINRICDQIQQSVGPNIRRRCLQRKQPNDIQHFQANAQLLTDFKYTLSLTRNSLEEKGLSSPPVLTGGYPPLVEDELKSPDTLITLLQEALPVLELGQQKVTNLLTVFKNEIYPLYPCISLEHSQGVVDSLFAHLSRVPRATTYNVEVIDVEIIKSILAVALLVTGDTQSSLTVDLESQLVWSVDSCLDQEHTQTEDIIMAALLSLYLDLKHRPAKAWRMAGVAAKLCLELGIHQERFFDSSHLQRDRITDFKRLFACVYDADRKLSFYSGLPWTLHDREIDMSILRVESQESYISTMISLNRIVPEMWAIVNAPSCRSTDSHERIEFLNFQLEKIVNSIPAEGFAPLEPSVVSPPWLLVGLKQFTYLRVHYMKLLAYIGAHSSIEDLISQRQAGKHLITLAVESVDIYMEMMNGSISPLLLPSTIKIVLSSLSFMLLAVSQLPTGYASLCTRPFHAAINILGTVQYSIKDPNLDICGTLDELCRFAEIIQLPSSKRPGSLINSPDLRQTLGQDNTFDELQTPASDFFSVLGGVNMSLPDTLYTNNVSALQ